MLLDIVRENQVVDYLKQMLKENGPISIAVPFWGEGIIELIGLDDKSHVNIVCNIESGACNPYVIEKIMSLKNVSIKSHPRLHAKLYIAPSKVIIGSSNASANGLPTEVFNSKAWIEANVISDESDLLIKANALFAKIWQDRRSHNISSPFLKEAKNRWDNRSNLQEIKENFQGLRNLIQACRLDLSLRSRVYVAIWQSKLSKQAQEAVDSFKNVAEDNRFDEQTIRQFWGYQFEKPAPPGAWIISCDCRDFDLPKIPCCSRATEISLNVGEKYDVQITIRQVAKSDSGERLMISADDKVKIAKYAKEIFNLSNKNAWDQLIPINKVINIIENSS